MKLLKVVYPAKGQLPGLIRLRFTTTIALLFVTSFTVMGSVLLFTTRAASPFASLEPEQGTKISGVGTNTDPQASGGQYVQFGGLTVSQGVCFARDPVSNGVPTDKFPGPACTGVPPGAILAPVNGNYDVSGDGNPDFHRIETSNTVIENKNFTAPLCIVASNVTIKKSRIRGGVSQAGPAEGACYGAGTLARNIIFEDVEIDGQNNESDAITGYGGGGVTCIRCNIHDASKGFSGSNLTIIDTVIYDLWGRGFAEPTLSHNEPVLGSTGKIIIRHSNLIGNFSAASGGQGGMSAALALYSHGSAWDDLDDVLIENNRLETNSAVYCAYGGDSDDKDPSNIRFKDNVFVRNASTGTCGLGGPIVAWLRGSGNLWQNNRFDDGQIINEP